MISLSIYQEHLLLLHFKTINRILDKIHRSFDGAEICKLVELQIQSNLENMLPKTNFGLYRDDGPIF